MRTTIIIDDALLADAQRLRALIERESARRLAALGGSAPELEDTPRRRPSKS